MRPNRDDMLMDIASVAAKRSTCSRASVGAVISREGRPMSLGYNGAPAGMPHCDHSCSCQRPLSPEGHSSWCKTSQPCLISVHAEVNALAFAARHGVATEGAELHTTHAPCLSCAMLIVNSGIIRVRWEKDYRLSEGVNLLRNVGIDAEPVLW